MQAPVCAGQALFVLLASGRRRKRLLLAQLGALTAAGVFYLPWLIAMKTHGHSGLQSMALLAENQTRLGVLLGLNNLIDNIFVDYPQLNWLVCTLMLAAGAAALLIFIRRSPPKNGQREFVFCLIAASLLPLLLRDLIYCSACTQAPYYWLPAHIGIIMIFAFAAVTLLGSKAKTAQVAGAALLASLIALGIISCFHNSTQYRHAGLSALPHLQEIAETINKAGAPVFVIRGEANVGQFMTLCRLLRDDIELHILPGDTIDSIPSQSQEAFVYTPWKGPIHVPFALDLRLNCSNFGSITRRDLPQ